MAEPSKNRCLMQPPNASAKLQASPIRVAAQPPQFNKVACQLQRSLGAEVEISTGLPRIVCTQDVCAPCGNANAKRASPRSPRSSSVEHHC
jgi:hypothetical protein